MKQNRVSICQYSARKNALMKNLQKRTSGISKLMTNSALYVCVLYVCKSAVLASFYLARTRMIIVLHASRENILDRNRVSISKYFILNVELGAQLYMNASRCKSSWNYSDNAVSVVQGRDLISICYHYGSLLSIGNYSRAKHWSLAKPMWISNKLNERLYT